MSLVRIVKSEYKKADASINKEIAGLDNYKDTRKQKFFFKFVEFLKLLGRKAQNRINYTVCKEEDSVYTFRVCNDKTKGISCYDELDIDELKRVRINGIDYFLCPKAKKVHSEGDYEKFKVK